MTEHTVARLTRITGGAQLARTLAREGVRTLADMRTPGVWSRLSEEARDNVTYNPRRQIPLAKADAIVAEVKRRMRLRTDGRLQRAGIISVGSVRRRAATVKDLDFLVMLPPSVDADSIKVVSMGLAPPGPRDRLEIAVAYAAGTKKHSLMLRYTEPGQRPWYMRSDFFITAAAARPYALFHYTGPTSYNIRTRALAKRKGWKLNQYGLFDAKTGERVRLSARIHTEEGLARFLGVTYRPPQNRR